MKKRAFIKNSSFCAGTVLLLSGLTSTRGYASTSSDDVCEWQLIPIGLQFSLSAEFSRPEGMSWKDWHDQILKDHVTSLDIARNAESPFAVFLGAGFTQDSVGALFEYSCDGVRGAAKIPPEVGISATISSTDDTLVITVWICVRLFAITFCPNGGETPPPSQPPAYDGPGSPQNPGAPPEWDPPSSPPPQYIADLIGDLPGGYV